MSDAQAVARVVSVGVFFITAVVVFNLALLSTTLDPSSLVGFLIFGTANLVAAGLAALPGRSVISRVAGALSLVPAVLLMNAQAGSSSAFAWLLLVGAAAVVLAGGLAAGTVARKGSGEASSQT